MTVSCANEETGDEDASRKSDRGSAGAGTAGGRLAARRRRTRAVRAGAAVSVAPERNAREVHAADDRLRPRPPRRDDPDARRRASCTRSSSIPKGAKNAPILLTRTPYDATALTTHAASAHLGPLLSGYDNATDVIIDGGYIRVVQDVRGKHGSEGDYVMNRPLSGPQNPTPVDHATDTYDTIDWLVKNVPESNGRVGILGISYDGFLPLMALVNPHPALKVSVPMNPMVDGWMGDDWFHNGAFRQQMMPYIYEQVSTRDNSAEWWSSHFDDYDMFIAAGSAGDLGARARPRAERVLEEARRASRTTTPSGAIRPWTRCWRRSR